MQDIEAGDEAGREVSSELRNRLRAQGLISEWDMCKYPIKAGYEPSQVQLHCVRNAEWQSIRLSMKGVDTYRKLEICAAWWDKNFELSNNGQLSTAQAVMIRNRTETQVGNYLGALRRGGQLNDDNQIRKAR